MKRMIPNPFFDFQFWRFAWANSTYVLATFKDGSVYWRIVGPLWWRETP